MDWHGAPSGVGHGGVGQRKTKEGVAGHKKERYLGLRKVVKDLSQSTSCMKHPCSITSQEKDTLLHVLGNIWILGEILTGVWCPMHITQMDGCACVEGERWGLGRVHKKKKKLRRK